MISVTEYQPLNGQAVYERPPTDSSMQDTIGMAYHLSMSAANHSWRGCERGTVGQNCGGSSNNVGGRSGCAWISKGCRSNADFGLGGFLPVTGVTIVNLRCCSFGGHLAPDANLSY